MPDISHRLLIAAPVEKVYDAITSQEGLSSWWTPNATVKPEVNSIARFPFGPDYHKEMKILELKPGEYAKWTCIKGADEWVDTELTFTLIACNVQLLQDHPEMRGQMEQLKNKDAITLLEFNHNNWRAYTPMFAECNYTWGQFLRSLKLVCETGKGKAWPDQHKVDL